MANTEKKERPIILELEDTKQAIIAAINTAAGTKGIPCYFIEPVLANILEQVRENARKELNSVRTQYEAREEK